MQSIGLVLTLSMLTGTLVALDLSDAQTQAHQTVLSATSHGLAIMPRSMPGLAVPKADIRNGVFAVGSSIGNEGLYERTDEADDDGDGGDGGDGRDDGDGGDDSDGSPALAEPSPGNDFVLI